LAPKDRKTASSLSLNIFGGYHEKLERHRPGRLMKKSISDGFGHG
jgi:hypothetical protein